MATPDQNIEATEQVRRSALAGRAPPLNKRGASETAFGRPRDFLENRFVYAVISARAGGLSLGVNMNPDKKCNFDCPYCEVNRLVPARESRLDVDVMADELWATLEMVHGGRLRERPAYQGLPAELLRLRHVALSGDGEPTLCPNFTEAVNGVLHVRARGRFPFFKVVLITNSSGLNQPEVQQGLRSLTLRDEIWAKLDVGTAAHLRAVNRTEVPLEQILANILDVGRQRPVIIQSLFPSIEGRDPTAGEISDFAARLNELKAGGAQISLVQIYSASRPTTHSECGHLPLRVLSAIAQKVRQITGLKVEVF